MNVFRIGLGIVGLMLLSCNGSSSDCKGEKGILKNLTGLDGCGWVVEVKNQNLEPTNLNEFDIELKEGKVVRLKYEEVSAASICMVGPMIKIICIED